MTNPADYRPKPGEIPTDPGVYRFRDPHDRVIYVGKAKNLRNRLANYFQPLKNLHPRTQRMVTTAARVEWTVVASDVEAFNLEYTWIKEFDPHFNVRLRDDKSYPYLAVTMEEKYPRVLVMRGDRKKGTRYFGPYPHVWAIRETVELLLNAFPIRTCSAGVLRHAERSGRPCLLGHIGKCAAPCVGWVSEDDHRAMAANLCDFMSGNTKQFTAALQSDMAQAAASLDFEKAAKYRDQLAALDQVMERNTIVLAVGTDADIFELAQDELEAAVQVFFIRDGRVRGQRGWVIEKVEDLSADELVTDILQSVYGDDNAEVPREVLVPYLPTEHGSVAGWLSGKRGSLVDIRVPQRGEKRALAETVKKNAVQALALHKVRRAGDLTTRSQALKEIQEALGLDDAPLRIECYDISHTQGTYQSASMVVFEDGLPRKAEYRRFAVKGPEGDGVADDTAAMREVLERRFRHGRASSESDIPDGGDAVDDDGSHEFRDEEGRLKHFAYPPNLLLVDGGLPQVNASAQVLSDLGVNDVALVGLAKRLEEVWVPGEDFPLILPRSSQGLYLLQRVRDEAHRFAITYHRKRRAKGMTVSAFDDIDGLGLVKQKALLAKFGSAARVKNATEEELSQVKGIGPRLAAVIFAAFHPVEGPKRDEGDGHTLDTAGIVEG